MRHPVQYFPKSQDRHITMIQFTIKKSRKSTIFTMETPLILLFQGLVLQEHFGGIFSPANILTINQNMELPQSWIQNVFCR